MRWMTGRASGLIRTRFTRSISGTDCGIMLLFCRFRALQYQRETHITNLGVALQMIAKVGIVYNSLERSDQKELLRQ